jgi:hypothetical protein
MALVREIRETVVRSADSDQEEDSYSALDEAAVMRLETDQEFCLALPSMCATG